MDDLVDLPDLTDEAVLDTLQQRFEQQQKIYTWVGSTLISINPYHDLGLCSPELIAAHVGLAAVNDGSLPPHVYSVAHAAYADMVHSGRSQSICNSGESGSGKTEATKIAMSFLASQSAARGGGGALEGQGEVERRIMESNPVLEAFGNAKTLKNNNSSRFGKYLDVQFDGRGSMVGATLTEFLLEKARVTTVGEAERSYHIFYQVCSALDGPEREAVPLLPAQQYKYLSGSSVLTVDGVDDQQNYLELRAGLRTLGVTDAQWLEVLKVLGAILSLGNLEISGGDDGDRVLISDTPAAAAVAEYLQCDREKLFEAMTTRKIQVAGEETSVPLRSDQVVELQQALAKALYHGLFRWIVETINRLLRVEEASSTIGILDIFGFEDFGDLNSFEQFCINFANEKLHRQFLHYVFELEEADYNAEGIEYSSVEFIDNQPCIVMIEGVGVGSGGPSVQQQGIISLLTETSKMPKGDDKLFQTRVEETHFDHANLITSRMRTDHFCVAHYAGAVKYNVDGFLRKNRDELQSDLRNVLFGSGSEQIAQYIRLDSGIEESEGEEGSDTKGSKKKKKRDQFIITKFSAQLTELVHRLTTSNTHYVRCIASNRTKSAMVFDVEHTAKQLRYAGVMDVCEVRQAGFAIRLPFDEFLRKYRNFVPGSAGDVATAETTEEKKHLCRSVLDQTEMTKHEYQLGKSKCFLKQKMIGALETLRQRLYNAASIKIQASFRRLRHYTTFKTLRRHTVALQCWVRRKQAVHRYRCVQAGMAALQAYARGHLARLAAGRLRNDTLRCQAMARGWLQRRVFAQLLLGHCRVLVDNLVLSSTADVGECLLFIQRRKDMDGLEDSIARLQMHSDGLVEQKRQELAALRSTGADYTTIASAAQWVIGLGEAGVCLAAEAVELERHRQEMVAEAKQDMTALLASQEPEEVTVALSKYKELEDQAPGEYSALQAHAMTMIDGVRATVVAFMAILEPDVAFPGGIASQMSVCRMFGGLMAKEEAMLQAALADVIHRAETTLRKLMQSTDEASIAQAIEHYSAANFRSGSEVRTLLKQVQKRLVVVRNAAVLAGELGSALGATELRQMRPMRQSYQLAEPAVREIVMESYELVNTHREALIHGLMQQVEALRVSRDYSRISARLPYLHAELNETDGWARELEPLRTLQAELVVEMTAKISEAISVEQRRPLMDPVATLSTLRKAEQFVEQPQVVAAREQLHDLYQQRLESARTMLVGAVHSADLRLALSLLRTHDEWVDLGEERRALEARVEELRAKAQHLLRGMIDTRHYTSSRPIAFQQVGAIRKALEVDFVGLGEELGGCYGALASHWRRLLEQHRKLMADALQNACEGGTGPFDAAAELVRVLLCARPYGNTLLKEVKQVEKRLDQAVAACASSCEEASQSKDLAVVVAAIVSSEPVAPLLKGPRAACNAQLQVLVRAAQSELRDCLAETCRDFGRIDAALEKFGDGEGGGSYTKHCARLLQDLRSKRQGLRNALCSQMEQMLLANGPLESDAEENSPGRSDAFETHGPLDIDRVLAAAAGCGDVDIATNRAALETQRDALIAAAVGRMQSAASGTELSVVENTLLELAGYHDSPPVLDAYAELQRSHEAMLASMRARVSALLKDPSCDATPLVSLLDEVEQSVARMGVGSALAPELEQLHARQDEALSAVHSLTQQLLASRDRAMVATAAEEFTQWAPGPAEEDVAALRRWELQLLKEEVKRLRRAVGAAVRGSLETATSVHRAGAAGALGAGARTNASRTSSRSHLAAGRHRGKRTTPSANRARGGHGGGGTTGAGMGSKSLPSRRK
jgi:myosin heavy subunit